MNTSGITAALPAQDLSRAKAFYAEKVGLQALESDFLKARDGQVGLTVGEGVSQLFVYPARVRSSGEFTQAVIHVADVRAAVEEMRGCPAPDKSARLTSLTCTGLFDWQTTLVAKTAKLCSRP